MIDLGSMHALLRLMPNGASLLMVGDERQLPPFGVGLVFHRLVGDDIIVSRLTTIHRQFDASGIPAFAGAIRSRMMLHLDPFDGSGTSVSLVRADTSARIGATAVQVAVDLGICPMMMS